MSVLQSTVDSCLSAFTILPRTMLACVGAIKSHTFIRSLGQINNFPERKETSQR